MPHLTIFIEMLFDKVKSRIPEHECSHWLFIYLVLILVPCFIVLFSALFRLQLMCPTQRWFRPNRSQIVRKLLYCVSVSYCAFVKERFSTGKSFFCEGALRYRNTREWYSKNLSAIGPKPTFIQLHTSVEDETEQKTRQENKTQGSKQGK